MKVLVVEDEPSLREIYVEELEDFGLEVLAVENGEVAKTQVESFAPDIIVSDVRMPQCSGIDFLKFLRANNNQTPLVFITGFADVSYDEAIKLGAKEVFYKPGDLKKMFAYIQVFFSEQQAG